MRPHKNKYNWGIRCISEGRNYIWGYKVNRKTRKTMKKDKRLKNESEEMANLKQIKQRFHDKKRYKRFKSKSMSKIGYYSSVDYRYKKERELKYQEIFKNPNSCDTFDRIWYIPKTKYSG